MRISLKTLSFLLAALPAAAAAQGFLPYGGVTGNSHFALEPVVSGYAATENAVLSHGSLPAISTYTSGIATVSADEAGIGIALSADGRSIAVNGPAKGYGYEIFAIDGRKLAEGTASEGTISLAGLAAGQYLLRLSGDGSSACGYNFIKRD